MAPHRAMACMGISTRPPVTSLIRGVVTHAQIVIRNMASVHPSFRVRGPISESFSRISSLSMGTLSISGGKMVVITSHPAGIIRRVAGSPMLIHVMKSTSTWASSFRKPIVRGLGPHPAGVAIPPKRGPQAQEIISPFPKLLSRGVTPDCLRMATPNGMRIAATAMSVIHMERRAPTIRNPSMTILVLVPMMESIR